MFDDLLTKLKHKPKLILSKNYVKPIEYTQGLHLLGYFYSNHSRRSLGTELNNRVNNGR